VTTFSSPTVQRRRLAAELRRLRGNRTGTVVAKALGWSPTKISRYELGHSSFPLDEVEKLLDYYGVAAPRRAALLSLAEEANQRGWWEDYADAISSEYMEYIGHEAGAASVAIWENVAVPGLLQTEEYARRVLATHRVAAPVPPGVLERRVQVRMVRQEILTRDPPIQLSIVLDESVLLRTVGGHEVMAAQLRQLAALSELPNVELRIFPLGREAPVFSASFEVFGFYAIDGTDRLGDVVSTESVGSYLYVEGETDTYLYRLFFQAMSDASLPPDDSRHLIVQTADRVWG
jgi:hypothetical protein